MYNVYRKWWVGCVIFLYFKMLLPYLVQYGSEGHQAAFTIKVGHSAIPKLYNSGSNKGM